MQYCFDLNIFLCRTKEISTDFNFFLQKRADFCAQLTIFRLNFLNVLHSTVNWLTVETDHFMFIFIFIGTSAAYDYKKMGVCDFPGWNIIFQVEWWNMLPQIHCWNLQGILKAIYCEASKSMSPSRCTRNPM